MSSGGIYNGLLSLKNILPNIFGDIIKINDCPEYLIKKDFNVSTFAPDLYLDFGIVGVIGFCLLLGVLCSVVFAKAKNNNFFKLAYSVLAYCLVFIFFVNMLFMSSIYFQFILIPILFCNLYSVKVKFFGAKVKTVNKTSGVAKEDNQISQLKNSQKTDTKNTIKNVQKIDVQKLNENEQINNNKQNNNEQKINGLRRKNKRK